MSDVRAHCLFQIFKIVAPYAILAVCFALMNARLHLPPFSLFLVALTLTDGEHQWDTFNLTVSVADVPPVMTITFFFKVTDTGQLLHLHVSSLTYLIFAGSWLEIGQTISFFCISSLLLVWSAGICAIGEILMADVLKTSTVRLQKSE